jgi:hypothetical protein
MLPRRARLLTSALCLLFYCTQAPLQGVAHAQASHHDDVPERQRDDNGNLLPIIGGALALIGGALLVDSLTGKDWASAKQLDRDGPVFPRKQAVGQFQVQGYALPGWPVVVDVAAEPGTETWLVVHYRGAKKKDQLRYRIPGEGRRVQVVQLPSAGPAAKLTTARFSLLSYRTVGEKKVYQPHMVYGIGAGPRAVGSTTLHIGTLAPAVARQAAEVRYTLVAKRLFDRSAVEVLRLPSGNKGKLKLVKAARRFPLPPGTHPGDWRQMQVDPKPAAGLYHFQARAWLVGGRSDERDWTGAIAPNFVRIP